MALRGGSGAKATIVAALAAAALLLLLAPDARAGSSALVARGSAEQVQVTGATPGAKVKLLAGRRDRPEKARRRARRRRLPAGRSRFRVHGRLERDGDGRGPCPQQSRQAAEHRDLQPDDPGDGYGYLTTRDGTKLAINVHLPGPPEDGPYPTLIEYSGYGYADPAGAARAGSQPIANLIGFAVVDVNMRGTGCSGGAFDFFEPLQSLDGYDVIETIARQPWVAQRQGRDDGHLLRRHQPAVRRRRRSRRAWPRSRRSR